MIRFSFTNHLAATGIVLTPSSVDTAYPASNLKEPQRPFLPFKTLAAGAQNVVIDFLSAKTIDLVHLVRANFTSATLQGNSSNDWASPPFTHSVTIARNAFNGRYQYGALLTSFAYRYLRLVIPSQTPLNGDTVYSLGGIWAGEATKPPKNFLFDVTFDVHEPRQEMQPDHGGWRQRLVLGEALARLTVNRRAKVTRKTPGFNDELASWLALDRQAREVDHFALFLDNGDSAQAYVARNVAPVSWNVDRLESARGEYSLEEVLGP